MKAKEFITEQSVTSSWIEDLTYIGDDTVLMTTMSGKTYELNGVTEEMYEEWISSYSKGKFWWSNIRDYL
jgi:hypothetical protein